MKALLRRSGNDEEGVTQVKDMNLDTEIRVMSTNPDRAKTIFGDKIEYARGDVGVRQSLIKAMDGCDYVYVNLKGGPTEKDYMRIQGDGSKNIYAAAKEVGIKKLVQISGATANENNAKIAYVRGKVEAQKALVKSGLTYVMLKPSWFCESLPLFVQGGKAIYIGSGKTKFHFLAVADYVRIVAQCFADDKADNQILTIFGPEAMPVPEAMRRFLAIAYPDVKINRMPVWLARWATMFAFNKNLKATVRMMAYFDKHDDSEADPGPEVANEIFGPCTTTVEEYAEMYRKITKG